MLERRRQAARSWWSSPTATTPPAGAAWATCSSSARDKETMIYAIGLESEFFIGPGRMQRTRPDRGLRKLADETGGGYFELKKTDELAPDVHARRAGAAQPLHARLHADGARQQGAQARGADEAAGHDGARAQELHRVATSGCRPTPVTEQEFRLRADRALEELQQRAAAAGRRARLRGRAAERRAADRLRGARAGEVRRQPERAGAADLGVGAVAQLQAAVVGRRGHVRAERRASGDARRTACSAAPRVVGAGLQAPGSRPASRRGRPCRRTPRARCSSRSAGRRPRPAPTRFASAVRQSFPGIVLRACCSRRR